MVPKKSQEWRPVGDYRALNRVTISDRYNLPLLQSFSLFLHSKQVFSKIDLRSAYHQIPINQEDIEKTRPPDFNVLIAGLPCHSVSRINDMRKYSLDAVRIKKGQKQCVGRHQGHYTHGPEAREDNLIRSV
jgi:hypothetical protein